MFQLLLNFFQSCYLGEQHNLVKNNVHCSKQTANNMFICYADYAVKENYKKNLFVFCVMNKIMICDFLVS